MTFVAQDGIWALRFGTAVAYEKFVTRYNDKLFVNTYGVENDEANRSKVDTLRHTVVAISRAVNEISKFATGAVSSIFISYHSRCAQVFGKDSFMTLGAETDESRQQWAADMDTDVSSSAGRQIIRLHSLQPYNHVTTASDVACWRNGAGY